MVKKNSYNSITVLGATATGKTSLAVELAKRYNGEILSADSRQVYTGLDIGSGKDLSEYGSVPYHLIDITDLSTEYSVFDYQQEFYKNFAQIQNQGKLPIISGGTGMYLDSILRSYSFERVPENQKLREELESFTLQELENRLRASKGNLHNTTDLENKERLVRAIEIAEKTQERAQEKTQPVPVSSFVLGIQYERTELRTRIEARLDARIAQGLIQEVENLYALGCPWERLERLGLEYRITAEYLQKKIPTFDEWRTTLLREIGRFAKRQETWFRGMERKGVSITWLQNGDRDQAYNLLDEYFISTKKV